MSLVGAGMRSTRALGEVLRALAEAGINIEMISTSEIRISVVIREDAWTTPCGLRTRRSSSTATTARRSSTAARADDVLVLVL